MLIVDMNILGKCLSLLFLLFQLNIASAATKEGFESDSLGFSSLSYANKDTDPFNSNGKLGRVLRDTVETTVCGVKLKVPAISYAICEVSISTLPATCNVAVAATVTGGPCAVHITTAASSCAVSVAKITEIAMACIKGDY